MVFISRFGLSLLRARVRVSQLFIAPVVLQEKKFLLVACILINCNHQNAKTNR